MPGGWVDVWDDEDPVAMVRAEQLVVERSLANCHEALQAAAGPNGSAVQGIVMPRIQHMPK